MTVRINTPVTVTMPMHMVDTVAVALDYFRDDNLDKYDPTAAELETVDELIIKLSDVVTWKAPYERPVHTGVKVRVGGPFGERRVTDVVDALIGFFAGLTVGIVSISVYLGVVA